MLRSNSSVFFRRLKLYGFGVAMGLVLSYAFFGDRYPTWLPGSRVMEDLARSEITYSEHAICLMDCRNISKAGIEEILSNGEVNFSDSEPRAKPCPSYAIEGTTKGGQSLRVMIFKCDSTSEVHAALNLNKSQACSCQ